MAVTKRTRYEVLRRDGHTCRYCGAAAPDAKLTVDHVVPVALGGSDDPSNLVTACADCNAGKASSSADASLVADVSADAMRHAELTRQAYAVLVETMGARDDYIDEVETAFAGERIPSDFRNSVARWFDMGVPVEIVTDAARIAKSKSGHFPGTNRFSYMAGIVWNQVTLVGEQVAQRAALDGAWMTEDARTNERIDSYMAGLEAGSRGAEQGRVLDDVLADFIDRNALAPREAVAALIPAREECI